MNLGLVLSLALHGALLLWALISIHATPAFKPPTERAIEVSILMEPGEVKSKKGDRDSKLLETSGAEGTASKAPPKPVKQATPAPPPVAAPPPPTPPEKQAAVIQDDPPPSPSPEDKKSLDDLIKAEAAKAAADKRAADKAAAEKAAADKAAKAEIEKAENDKAEAEKLAAEKAAQAAAAAAEKKAADKLAADKAAEKRAADKKIADKKLADKRAADKLAADKKAAEEAKKKEFNPNAIADAIKNAKEPNDGQPSINQTTRPKADNVAGARVPGRLPPGKSAGTPDGRDNKISGDEASLLIRMLRQQVQRCWVIVPGPEAMNMRPVFEFELTQDGRLNGEPRLTNSNPSPEFRSAVDAALRAIKQCQPYNLPADKYQHWQGVELDFDPSKMTR